MAKKQAPRSVKLPVPKPAASVGKSKAVAAPSKAGKTPGSRSWLWSALVAVAIAFVCHLPGAWNEFVNWDDDPNILENPNLEHLDGQSFRNIFDLEKGNVIGNYNPLPIATFYLEKKIAGRHSPALIHFNNVVLHAATVFFVIRLLLLMGISIGGAFVGGLLFGIHPMRVESVAWATERKDVLFAVFFFAALTLYMRWVKAEDAGKRTGLYLGMIGLATLSLFSKVQAVTLPLSMLALDYWLRRPLSLRLIWEKAPFWALSLTFGLINLATLKAQGSTNDDVTNFNFVDRLCIGAYSFCVYLYKLVLPYPMLPVYAYPSKLPMAVYLSPILFFAVWAGMFLLWRRDRRAVVFGFVFFFFNVMFLLQVLAAGQGFLADRFTYVAYFGFFAIAAWAYDRYAASSNAKTTVQWSLGGLFLIYAIATWRQTSIWRNSETLWSHVLKHNGGRDSQPYWNRGRYRREQEKFDAALDDYNAAIKVDQKNPELYNSRGKTYFDLSTNPQYKSRSRELAQKALEDYTAALNCPRIKLKTQAEALINRSAAYGAAGQMEAALKDANEGIALDPKNKNGYFNRSLIYFNLRQFDKTIEDYTTYLGLDPYNANIYYERGMLRRSLNQSQPAIEDLSRAIELKPDLGLAYLERARALAQSGNVAAARQDYQRAQQMGQQLSGMDAKYLNER